MTSQLTNVINARDLEVNRAYGKCAAQEEFDIEAMLGSNGAKIKEYANARGPPYNLYLVPFVLRGHQRWEARVTQGTRRAMDPLLICLNEFYTHQEAPANSPFPL